MEHIHAEAAVHEDFDEALVQGLRIDLRCGGRENGPHRLGNLPPPDDGRDHPQVLDAAVGAGADIDLIDGRAGHVGHIPDLVRLVAIAHLWIYILRKVEIRPTDIAAPFCVLMAPR